MDGIANMFSGVNPAQAGFDVGTAAAMANRYGGGMPPSSPVRPQAMNSPVQPQGAIRAPGAPSGVNLQPQGGYSGPSGYNFKGGMEFGPFAQQRLMGPSAQVQPFGMQSGPQFNPQAIQQAQAQAQAQLQQQLPGAQPVNQSQAPSARPLSMPNAAMPNAAMPNAAMPNAAMPNAAMPNAAMPNAAMQRGPGPVGYGQFAGPQGAPYAGLGGLAQAFGRY